MNLNRFSWLLLCSLILFTNSAFADDPAKTTTDTAKPPAITTTGIPSTQPLNDKEAAERAAAFRAALQKAAAANTQNQGTTAAAPANQLAQRNAFLEALKKAQMQQQQQTETQAKSIETKEGVTK